MNRNKARGATANLNSNANALKKMMERTSRQYGNKVVLNGLYKMARTMNNQPGMKLEANMAWNSHDEKEKTALPISNEMYNLHNRSLKAIEELKELKNLEEKRRKLTEKIKNLKNKYEMMINRQNNMTRVKNNKAK